MGIYRQFPYSNFHDFNLDWIIAQLRGINDKLDEALDLIQHKLADLINDEEVREKIDELIAEYLTPEEIDSIVSDILLSLTNVPYKQPIPEFIPINDGKFKLKQDSVNQVNQGMCTDGRYMYCYRSNSAGIGNGMLDVYDMNGETDRNIVNWTYIRSQPIDLAHGNTLFYKEDTNEIYVVAMKSGQPEIPDNRVFVVDPQELTIKETITLEYALNGLCYNSQLHKWVGWFVADGNYLIFWDKDFNLLETFQMTQNFNNRVGLFADNDYIYVLQTGAYGEYVAGQITECRISIYDWFKNYRGDTIIHNAEELEALAWTGTTHVAMFNGSLTEGYSDYVSLVQLKPSEYQAYSFYRTHWGQNQLVFEATSDNDLFMTLNANIPAPDPRLPYTATHLEFELTTGYTTAPVVMVVPRSYGRSNKSSWHTVTFVTSSQIITQCIRVRQENGSIFLTGCYGKKIDNNGNVTTFDENNPALKIIRIRACNYTMQPMYNSYAKI